jgi:hypothetical protein
METSMRSEIASFAVVALVLSLASCGSNPDLDLRVRRLGDEIVVTNNEPVGLKGCWVQINARYTRKGVALPPNQDVNLPISRFTTGDGTRFNLALQEPQEILVQCFEPEGRSAFFGL